MTKTDQFTHRVETELRTNRTISADTCKLWEALDHQEQVALAGALAFIGCPRCTDRGIPPVITSQEDRFGASRLMLLKLRLDTNDPAWSSELLERYVRSVLSIPTASLDDVFIPLSVLIGEADIELSATLAHFLKDIVILCFTQHRTLYDTIDWDAFIRSLGPRPTQAQCYLALHAVPPDETTLSLAEMITARLAGSRYHEEAAIALAVTSDDSSK